MPSRGTIRIFILIILLGLLAYAGALLSGQAYAASVCETIVNDNASLLRPEEKIAVQAAAQEVKNLGADVHVVTVTNLPNPDANTGDQDKSELQKWMDQQQAQCPTWQRPNGERKGNLIVVAFSLNPLRSGIYAGDVWQNSIKNDSSKIRSSMSPAFKDGAIGTAFVTGLHGLRDSILKSRNTYQQPDVPTAPSEPIDWSWLLWVVYFLGGLLAVGLLITGIVLLWKSAKRKRGEKQKATQATSELNEQVLSLSEINSQLTDRVELLRGSFTEEDMRPIQELLAEFNRLYDVVTTEQGEILGTVDDRDEQQESAAQATILDAKQGNKAAKQAHLIAEQLTAALDELVALPNQLPQRIATTTAKVAAARDHVSAIGKDFKTTSQQDLLTDAEARVAWATKACEEKRYTAGSILLDEANSLAETAETEAKRLPETKKALEVRVINVRDKRVPELSAAIAQGETTLQQLHERYAAVHSDDLSENCSRARTLLDGVPEILERAERAITDQDWTQADQVLAQAEQQVAQGFTLLQAIKERNNGLTKLAKSAPQRAIEALSAIARVTTFASQHRDDIVTDVSETLDNARRRIDAAQQLLSQSKPDYNKVTDLLSFAESETAEAMSTIQGEHQRAVQQREHAERQRREAERRLADARRYVRDNGSYVDSSTARRLDELERRRTSDLTDAAFWASVASAAEAIRSQAESDVDRNTPAPTTSYGSSSYGNTDDSGGLGFSSTTDDSGGFSGGDTNDSGAL